MFRLPFVLLCLGLVAVAEGADGPLRLERQVVDTKFAGGYQVEVADVNGDGKPDIIGVGGTTCAWFENPTWTKRIITTGKQSPGIISSATADLDGDGKAEVLIAHDFNLDAPTKGKLILARQGATIDSPWTIQPVADVGSIHRLRFADVDGDRKLDLVVAPIVGAKAKAPSYKEEPTTLLTFFPNLKAEPTTWRNEPIGGDQVLHAIRAIDTDGNGKAEILSAGNAGVTMFSRDPGGMWTPRPLIPGAPGEAPKKGSSEVHLGKLADGRRFLATIDPWHGTEVAVCLSNSTSRLTFGPRQVIDTTIKDGHALWVADFDGDGDDEILAGYRGPGTSVLAFQFDRKSSSWKKFYQDADIAAQDLRGADLDGDGKPEAVAIGGKTANVVIYRVAR